MTKPTSLQTATFPLPPTHSMVGTSSHRAKHVHVHRQYRLSNNLYGSHPAVFITKPRSFRLTQTGSILIQLVTLTRVLHVLACTSAILTHVNTKKIYEGKYDTNLMGPPLFSHYF